MKILFFFMVQLFAGITQAQILKVSDGSNMTILNGTVFNVENLTLIPSADFTISNTTLGKFTTVTHTTANPYISRVYRFTNNTNAFSGSVQINYTDGAELNGIPENQLTLNIHNGTSWNAHPATTRNGTINFVLTNVSPSKYLRLHFKYKSIRSHLKRHVKCFGKGSYKKRKVYFKDNCFYRS